MTPRAGDLNRRVRIERQTGAGGLSETLAWVPVATVWANVRTRDGREVMAADTTVSQISASIRIRYRTDIRPGMRATVDGATYRVQSVLPHVASRQYVDLVCISDEC